jgi:hypothetical protein
VSTTLAVEVLAEAEAMGLHLRLVDGKVKALFAADDRVRVAPVLERLRTNRDEVADVLRRRADAPSMPPGVQLLSWKLREPPIAIERWSVVNDAALFAHNTLEQLEAALAGKNWLAGNWSVRELVERLEQVGVVVRVEADCQRGLDPTVMTNEN